MIPPGAQAEAIAALPVQALRLPDDMVATLRRLGFERVGEQIDDIDGLEYVYETTWPQEGD